MSIKVTHTFVSPKSEQADPTIVGPNEWNAVHTAIDSNPIFISTDYNFACIYPGGTLVSGIANTIVLPNVPIGVNGTDTHHYLYIKDSNSALSEAVLITGGTAISGGTNQTLTFVPSNNHSGSWCVQSATAGIQEAVQVLQSISPTNQNGGTVQIPHGNYTVYATTTIQGNGIHICGEGWQNNTIITIGVVNLVPISFLSNNTACSITDLAFLGSGSDTTNWAIKTNGMDRCYFARLFVDGFANGIYVYENTNSFWKDIWVLNFTGDGVYLVAGNNALTFDSFIVSGGSTGNCLHIIGSGQNLVVNSSFLGAGNGFLCDPTTTGVFSVDFTNCFFDHNHSQAVMITPNGGGAIRFRFVQCWMCSAGNIGIYIAGAAGSTTNDYILDACHVCSNAVDGIFITGPVVNVKVLGCEIFNNAANGIVLYSGTNITIASNTIGNDSEWGSGTPQSYGVYFGSTPAISGLVLTSNLFVNNAGVPITGLANLTNAVINNNAGIDNVVQSIISSSSVSLTYNSVYEITGVISVLNLTGGWPGRRVKIIKTDTGTLAIGGGGNIPGVHTLSQYGSVILDFDGTNWY